ncbi:MAG: ATP-binding cassette domain-containing protein [Lachnospiraceae bacterium]
MGVLNIIIYHFKELNCIHLRQKLIGVVEQEPDFINDTIYNNLCLYNQYAQSYKIDAIMKEWNLKGVVEFPKIDLNLIINEKNSNLSGGEKQKLAVIRSCLKNPEVIFWDEPTASMDFESTKKVLEFIEQEKSKKIVIIITHDITVAEKCDYQIKIK